MALGLKLAAWGLMPASPISSLLEAWSLWPVSIGPCFVELVPGWNGWPEKILMRVFWGFSVSGM